MMAIARARKVQRRKREHLKVASGYISPFKGRSNPGQAERMKARYENDPEFAERNAIQLRAVRLAVPHNGPRPKQSDALRIRYEQDPVFRQRIAGHLLKVNPALHNPNWTEEAGTRWRAYYADEEARKAAAVRRKAFWDDPEVGPSRRAQAAERAAENLKRRAYRANASKIAFEADAPRQS